MTALNKEREAFEAWAKPLGDSTWREKNDRLLAWQAWEARASLASTPSALPVEGAEWMPFALTLATALDRGDDAALLMDENSPLRDELRRLIAQERAITSESVAEVKEAERDCMFTPGHADFERRQTFTAPIVGSWPWLRGCINGIPKREEFLGGQRTRYVQLDEVLGWIDEGERRAALDSPAIVGTPSKEGAGQVEAVTVEAVATIVRTDDGLDLEWLVEGGIASMVEGETLLICGERLTDNTGSGEVYRHPPASPSEGGGEPQALRSALERLAYSYRLLLARKPVRDVEETLAEVDHALSLSPSRGEAVDAARYRWLRSTTTKVTNHLGEKVAVTPDLMDQTIDAAIQSQGAKP